MKIDQPGIYDLSVKEYFLDPVAGGSLTSSGARLLLPPNCPAMFHYQRSHPRPNSATFDDGHAAHAVALGVGAPMRIVDADDFKTKAARAEREEAYAAGEIPVLAKVWTRIQGMAAALRNHDEAGPLFTPGAGLAEQTIVWWDEEFGIWRRAMVDWLPHTEPDERQIVVDYKGLSIDTPIPTPTGWTTMRSLNVGDTVFGGDGAPCVVTGKSEVHWRTCYRIRFDD